MKTFLVKLVFDVTVGGEHQHFDEQLRVFTATSRGEALATANSLGEEEAQRFVNTKGEVIAWKFSGATDIIEITGKPNGSLLFSESKYNEDVRGYAVFIRSKAIAVSGGIPTFV